MSGEEIANIKKTLSVLHQEISNLIQHSKIQVENLNATTKSYNDMVEVSVNGKDKHIFELEFENAKLKTLR